jgi:hypothetical protein
MASDYGNFDHYLEENSRSMRLILAVLAILFPILVIGAGSLDGVPLQGSLSAYYWATGSDLHLARVPFVGLLLAIGAMLGVYRGFMREEDHVLNAAGLFAIGVVWFPMEWPGKSAFGSQVHGWVASLLFVCLAYVMWFRAKDTLKFVWNPAKHRFYWRAYNVLSLCMLMTPIVAAALNHFLGGSVFVLMAEIVGVWSFAAFWLVKDSELQLTLTRKP